LKAKDVDQMLVDKRRCLMTTVATSLGKNPKYMEVGFNAGHSSTMMLETFPDLKVVAFDLCAHDYTLAAFEFLKSKFPDRITLTCGNSETTVPAHGRGSALRSFDAIFVDAGHFYFNALTDIISTADFAKVRSSTNNKKLLVLKHF
jgi:predicted O-methyltransferase YrrM